MKLAAVLLREAVDTPKKLLLAVQSKLLEAYPSFETEMSLIPAPAGNDILFYEPTTVFCLKATMSSLPTVEVCVQQREDGQVATNIRCRDSSSTFTAGPSEALAHHLSSRMIETLCEEMTYHAKYPNDGIPSLIEGWIYKEITKLFKYLDNGRLKSAEDIFVEYVRYVPSAQSKEEVDEAVKQLEAKHDATIVTERSVLGRLYFILAKLS